MIEHQIGYGPVMVGWSLFSDCCKCLIVSIFSIDVLICDNRGTACVAGSILVSVHDRQPFGGCRPAWQLGVLADRLVRKA
jgi:hypothetical protein